MSPDRLPHPLVLVADADQSTRLSYCSWLHSAGYETDEADDGRLALALALERHPSLIVAESRLPGITGLDLCRLLRTDPGTRDISIAILTAPARPGEIELAEKAGADSILIKPCPAENLLATAQTLLQKSALLRSHSQELKERTTEQLARARALMDRAAQTIKVPLRKQMVRGQTVTPPRLPPELRCPLCDRMLTYRESFLGGVNPRVAEQWDDYECPADCGRFKYRHRTKKLQRVSM